MGFSAELFVVMRSFIYKIYVIFAIIHLVGCIHWKKNDVMGPVDLILDDEQPVMEKNLLTFDEELFQESGTEEELLDIEKISDQICEGDQEEEQLQKALVQLNVPEVGLVGRCKNYFLVKYRDDYESALVRRRLSIEMIQDQVRQRGMPEAVKWIPMVESWFLNSATSKSNAAGLWQLMPMTARSFGLRIDKWIDERRDPVKATQAALDLLEYLYEKTGNWFLAFAAYHSGEGCVFKAIRNNGSEDYWEMAQKKEFSPQTRFYVAALMALALIERDPESHGVMFPAPKMQEMTVLSLDKQLDLRFLSEKTGIPLQKIKELNPALKRNITPPEYPGFELNIPVDHFKKIQDFLALANSGDKEIEYVIQPGDTLIGISYRFGITVESLMATNLLQNDLIIAGRKLLIPAF